MVDAFALSGRFLLAVFPAYQSVGSISRASIIDEGIIAVGSLEEVTLRTHGLRTAVAFEHQILVAIITLLEQHGGVIAVVGFVVFHPIGRRKAVVGPVCIQIYVAWLAIGL